MSVDGPFLPAREKAMKEWQLTPSNITSNTLDKTPAEHNALLKT